MTEFVYGCCVGWWGEFGQYVAPDMTGRAVIALGGQTSIADAYNRILGMAHDQYPDRAVVLVHADLEMLNVSEAEATLRALFDSATPPAMVGVAGAYNVRSLDWWLYESVGHQMTDSQDIQFAIPTGEVEILEGSFLAFSPDAARDLRFDMRFPGFHGYDELSYRAYRSGLRVVVADIDTHHHNTMGYKTPESALQWQECDRLFRAKWEL